MKTKNKIKHRIKPVSLKKLEDYGIQLSKAFEKSHPGFKPDFYVGYAIGAIDTWRKWEAGINEMLDESQ